MRKAVLAGGVGALLIAGVAALLLLRRPAPVPDVGFENLLARVDASLSQGYLSTAADALRSFRGVRPAEADQLRILKRAFEIGRSSGDYTLLALLSDRARAANARSPRIRSVAAYAFLRTGRVADALQLFSGRAPGEQETLRGESLLRSGAAWAGSDELSRDVLALESSADPSAFERAAIRADEARLSLDGAVLAMKQGTPSRAVAIARTDLTDPRFDEPAGLILYDAGAGQEAIPRLTRRFTTGAGAGQIGFVLSDLAAGAGNVALAQAWLRRSLPLAPTASWTPYADLAVFSLQRGDLAAASRRLQDGLAFFPTSRELRLLKARVLARAGDTAAASTILGSLLVERPADTEAALLLLSLQGPVMSPEALRARLWKVFDLAPTDAAVFDRLASALSASGDWDGLRIAAEERQAAGGAPDAHALLLEGFAAAMRGDDDAALVAFREADHLAGDGTGRFDAALVLLRRGRAREARDELEAAAGEVQARADAAGKPQFLSRVETARGAALMLDGDFESAAAALARARQLDGNNLRASLLMRKLEAGGQ
ncbi:MAG TPA: tetratricopeptide repeat protein [Spirochaetia bacterium]|nr:tetratricopeptide repeat protein [Spirochaetia bacterium]